MFKFSSTYSALQFPNSSTGQRTSKAWKPESLHGQSLSSRMMGTNPNLLGKTWSDSVKSLESRHSTSPINFLRTSTKWPNIFRICQKHVETRFCLVKPWLSNKSWKPSPKPTIPAAQLPLAQRPPVLAELGQGFGQDLYLGGFADEGIAHHLAKARKRCGSRREWIARISEWAGAGKI